jgi:hypothetical protein
MGAIISVRPNCASTPVSQALFHFRTDSSNAVGSRPMTAASAGMLAARLTQPFASSALLSSLQSYFSMICVHP